jgi:hypothetical protein
MTRVHTPGFSFLYQFIFLSVCCCLATHASKAECCIPDNDTIIIIIIVVVVIICFSTSHRRQIVVRLDYFVLSYAPPYSVTNVDVEVHLQWNAYLILFIYTKGLWSLSRGIIIFKYQQKKHFILKHRIATDVYDV